MSGDRSVLGTILRARRLAAGLSQQQLSEASGLSVRAIGDLERGSARRPHPDSLRLLAEALDIRGQARAEFFAAGHRHDAVVAAAFSDLSGTEPQSQRPGTLVPRQLPAPPRHFAGRSRELAVLAGMLERAGQDARPAVVISAIGGLAGVGKTALAVQFAVQVAASFPDGQLYVNLRGYDPALPPLAAADAVRVFLDAFEIPADRMPASAEGQAGLYRSVLAGKQVLIVLDNAADAAQVRPLLPGSPGCLVLVTSRSKLAGLVATDGAVPLPLDVLTDAEARDLLAGIAGASRVAAEPEAAGQLIDAGGRLPLALAITAARAATNPGLPLAAMAAELGHAADRLDALQSAGDPLASVRAALASSCRHLGDGASRMFRLLGLHPGPDISLPAAASLAGLRGSQASRHLAELAEASLISHDSPGGRYALHDLVRLYAAEQARRVDSAAEHEVVTGRMLDHYLHTGHAAAGLLNPGREPVNVDPPSPGTAPEHLADYQAAMSWFEAERRVLIAAVGLAFAAGQDTQAWNIAWTLYEYLYDRGHWHDQAAVATVALAAASRRGDLALQAKSHAYLANSTTSLGRYDDAEASHLRALDLFRQVDDPIGEAHVHLCLSELVNLRGQHARAADHAREALERFTSARHELGQAYAFNNLGWSLNMLGEYEQALAHCQQALALCSSVGSREIRAATLDTIGYAHHHVGQYDEAITCYQQALDIALEAGNRRQQADVLSHLGDARQATGNLDAARTAWRNARAIFNDLQHPNAKQVHARLNAADTGHTAAARDTDPRG